MHKLVLAVLAATHLNVGTVGCGSGQLSASAERSLAWTIGPALIAELSSVPSPSLAPPSEIAEIDPKMHETAKIILKPPFMRLDSGAQMDSKLHIERVQSFSLRPGDKKPENSML